MPTYRVRVVTALILKESSVERYIEKFKTHLIAEKNASENTVTSYLNDLHQFFQFLTASGHACDSKGSMDIQQIDRLAVRSFLVHLHERKLTGTTMSRKLSSLNTFFKFLCREGHLENNIAKSIPSPKKENYLPSFLSVDDIFRLLELPENSTWIGSRDRAMLEMFYSTGMRISELASLQMDFLNPENRRVRVLGKGKKERWLPLGEKAFAALNIYLNRRETLIKKKKLNPAPSIIFLNARGSGLTTRGVRKIVGNIWISWFQATIHHIQSVIHSQLIYWKAGPTCVPFRRCWDMPASRPPKNTLI